MKLDKIKVEIQWLLYKFFNKNRIIPCGRNKETANKGCMQPFIKERIYLSADNKTAYCKVCNRVLMVRELGIDLNKFCR